MTKVIFKESMFSNAVIRKIDNTIGYMNSAVSASYSMSIPSSFSLKGDLENSKSEISKIKNDLVALKDWGDKSISILRDGVENMTSVASMLPNSQLKMRSTAIK